MRYIFFSNEWADFGIDRFAYFWYYNSPALYSVTARREKFMNSGDDMYSVWGLDDENCYAPMEEETENHHAPHALFYSISLPFKCFLFSPWLYQCKR